MTTSKSERTRKRIVDAALALFRKRGYEKTTMALIAKKAGVSKGNAYYYFRSKEELIQGFYDEIQTKHRALVEERLRGVDDLAERIRITLHAWQDVAAPYHAFADKLFKNAASPTSPLSPFSPESKSARDQAIALHRMAVRGVDDEDEVAHALWLLHMGVVLFWVFDRSADQRKTRDVVDKIVPLATGLLPMMPMLAPMLHDVFEGLTDV